MPGRLFWITGLSKAGKTCIGRALYRKLSLKKKPVVFLDGDQLRAVFGEQSDYSRENRLRLSRQYSGLCKVLTDQGVDVVCATICLFHSCQAWNRKHIKQYCEIYVKAPMSVLKMRDEKGVYERAYQGEIKNVVGFDITPEYPVSPELAIENDGVRSPEELADEILKMTGLTNHETG